MREIIENFSRQFAYEPEIQNAESLGKFKKFVLGGMGGSHLAADLLKVWKPELNLQIHSDYGLPFSSNSEKTFFVASSYSGETEETIDFFEKAVEKKFPAVALGTGGRLIKLAQQYNLPYIIFPNDAVQPRLALGYSLRSLLKIIGDEDGFKESGKLAQTLKPSDYEREGKSLAEKLKDSILIAVYASRRNLGLALNWRVRINETAKMPSYFHVFPELNHNEIAADFKKGFHFIILRDESDDPKILKRMDVLAKLYREKGRPVEIIDLRGRGLLKIFSAVVLADWFSYYLASAYGVDPLSNPMVEEFKKRL